MNRFSKLAAAISVLSVLVLAPIAYATGGGQIEQGDIYRVKDVTNNSAFADNISAACGDTVAFRVRIHNGGPDTTTNVKVAATLNGASSTSHGSQVSLSADNNLHNMTVTANAGVNTSVATTATYVSGSTQLLNFSTTPGGESVLKNLPDGILGGGINIGSIGPLTADTEEVQFEANINCPQPVPTPVFSCDALHVTAQGNRAYSYSVDATAKNGAAITGYAFDFGDSNSVNTTVNSTTHTYAKDGTYTSTATVKFNVGNSQKTAACTQNITVSTPVTPQVKASVTSLPNTGPGDMLGIFAGTSGIGAVGHYVVNRRRRN